MGNAGTRAAEGGDLAFTDHGAAGATDAPFAHDISSPFVQQDLVPSSFPLPTTHLSADSPTLCSPQVPKYQMDEQGCPHYHQCQSNTSSIQDEHKIATLIEWCHGGTEVFVEGSWDNWRSRTPLHRAGKDFMVVKFLPEGVYHYKYIVNGEWRCSSDLPHIYDENGNGINFLDVQDFVPENLDGVAEFEAPSSPDSNYDCPFMGPDDFSKDPPALPSQLQINNQLESYQQHLKPNSGSTYASICPQHVILNHLFVESRRATSRAVLALSLTHRFRTKYVTVILHKPL